MVRTLHPNLQREPSVKRFAELHMKRVSRAYAVLSDVERRRRYDAELASGGATAPAPVLPVAHKRTRGRSRARAWITLGWMICAFAGIIGIGWYMSQQSTAPPAPSEVRAAPGAPAAGSALATAPSAASPNAEVPSATVPSAAPPAPATPTTAPLSTPLPGSAQAAEPGDLDSLRSELAAAKADRDRALGQVVLQKKELDFLANRILSAPTAQKRFGGVWILPKTGAAASNSSFAPVAADLIVAEAGGTLEGRYRARYPTMGRPEPTVVRFYFEGKAQGSVANSAWNSDGGASGDVQLRLVSENSLELVWSATELGKEAGPGSGTVLLVRRREP